MAFKTLVLITRQVANPSVSDAKTKRMMTMQTQTALITSRDPKGMQAMSIFEAVYNKARLDDSSAQRLNERGDELKTGISKLIAELSAFRHYNDEKARSILGTDFITPEEVMKAHPDVIYTDKHLAFLAETMPSEEDLRWCKDNGYAVMPAPPDPITLLDVRALKVSHFYSETGGWYANQKFASNDKTRRGWLAVRKEPVPNLILKTWNERKKLLSGVEDMPNAAEMAWFIITYFEVRDVRLFENVLVCTRSFRSDGCHIDVGKFGQGGLRVHDHWGGDRDSRIGVSSARKF